MRLISFTTPPSGLLGSDATLLVRQRVEQYVHLEVVDSAGDGQAFFWESKLHFHHPFVDLVASLAGGHALTADLLGNLSDRGLLTSAGDRWR